MKQTRIIKRTTSPGNAYQVRSSRDPRDPDVVRAKALSSASSHRAATPAWRRPAA